LFRHSKPDIFNTDQGSQFTGEAFTGVLADNAIAISLNGKGCLARQRLGGAVMAQRQIREVYLRIYDSVGKARASIGCYVDFYNSGRPHSSLDGATPDRAYFNPLPLRLAA
jgi:putative transposase